MTVAMAVAVRAVTPWSSRPYRQIADKASVTCGGEDGGGTRRASDIGAPGSVYYGAAGGDAAECALRDASRGGRVGAATVALGVMAEVRALADAVRQLRADNEELASVLRTGRWALALRSHRSSPVSPAAASSDHAACNGWRCGDMASGGLRWPPSPPLPAIMGPPVRSDLVLSTQTPTQVVATCRQIPRKQRPCP